MAKNLKVKHYRNGEPIADVTDNSEWSNFSFSACCIYHNDPTHAATYGRLYNWYAVNDSRKIAPAGWHVSSDEDCKQLELYLGMSQKEVDRTGWRGTDEGRKIKTTGTIEERTGLWHAPHTGATNESSFSVLPGYYRGTDGAFANVGYSA